MKRVIEAIKRKIYLIIGRAILTAVNNTEGTQKIQVKGLSGETITDIERFEEYGLTTMPLTDSEAEAVIGFINGNRDLGIVLCIHDRSKRPTDLNIGDVCLYHYTDNNSKYRIQLKDAGLLEVTVPKEFKVDVTDSSFGVMNLISAKEMNLNGVNININASDVINIEASNTTNIGAETVNMDGITINIDGSSTVNIGNTGGALEKLLNKVAMDRYNEHKHPSPAGGNTGIPNHQMSEDTHTTVKTKAN